MPFYEKIELPGTSIGLWRIEEDISWFEPKFPPVNILNEGKRLQWYATRHLVNELCGKNCEVIKDEAGKPYLKGSTTHISISHTPVYAAVMVCPAQPVGVDLEMINPKVERIVNRFLRPDEIATISPAEKYEKMILYWSAKEALYKYYGKRNVEFISQLLIDPFTMQKGGELKAEIRISENNSQRVNVQYRFFEDHVLTYVTGR